MPDLNFYRALLAVLFAVIFVPMLFEIGKQMPAYTFTAWTWLVGLLLSGVPAFLGYLIGRAAAAEAK